MANFDLGLALCRIRDSITSVEGKYFRYIVKNNLDMKDEENIYVKNIFELERTKSGLYKCKTEEDAQALINRIYELRKFIDEVEGKFMLSIYPACFFKEKTGVCNVVFPDFNDATTFGNSFDEAMSMAVDLLAGLIIDIKEENGTLPDSSYPDELKPEERYPELAKDCESVFVNMVTVDVDEYAKNNFI